MRSLARVLTAALVVAVISAAAACCAPPAGSSLIARAPDGMRIAVATAGARNVRVLHVDSGSIVRLREVFVPEGESVAAIAWSGDGRELIVTTRGPMYAVDTRTWHVEPGADPGRRVAREARHG